MTSSSEQPLSAKELMVLGGIAAVIYKTASAPLDRYQQIVQLRKTILEKDISNDIDQETLKNPSFCSFVLSQDVHGLFLGNGYGVIRYFQTQILDFLFRDSIHSMFKHSPKDSRLTAMGKKVLSGGMAETVSLAFVYSFDRMMTVHNLGIAEDAESKYKWTFGPLSKGFALSSSGLFLYRASLFGLFDSGRWVLGDKATMAQQFLFGYLVTVLVPRIHLVMNIIKHHGQIDYVKIMT